MQVWCYICDDYFSTDGLFDWLKEASQKRRDTGKPDKQQSPSRRSTISVPSGYGTNFNSSSISIVGLHNLGNTCYMNAALQVMLNWYQSRISIYGIL